MISSDGAEPPTASAQAELQLQRRRSLSRIAKPIDAELTNLGSRVSGRFSNASRVAQVEAKLVASSEEMSGRIDDIVALVPSIKPNTVGLLTGAGGLEGAPNERSRVLQTLGRQPRTSFRMIGPILARKSRFDNLRYGSLPHHSPAQGDQPIGNCGTSHLSLWAVRRLSAVLSCSKDAPERGVSKPRTAENLISIQPSATQSAFFPAVYESDR
jgi:hypothetical protein